MSTLKSVNHVNPLFCRLNTDDSIFSGNKKATPF
ncbi:hypothetical protein SAMN05421821_101207 [Mucilaginibacter lappiensis]|uniref:Uncharacterized protein n=1 Tax=Mucilaginibacter lappiensis TaxID=354630 RepID=A0A1N6NPD6_9SPHI|nr:hypothetical protein [Mucilaginibacter lappiensis]MBB6126050.1 hypothetical protein [Mucilaginibacter lappiensis]SIP93965.1 hypothetical protein SAMN05421821_101207 [Mucilaginibacter lappiensis]